MFRKVKYTFRENKLEVSILIFIILIMIISPNNHNLKGIIKSVGISTVFTTILILMKKIYLSIEDRLIYLLGLMIPFTTILSEPKNPNNMLLAGSKAYFTITIYDCIIFFLIIAYIEKNNFKPKIKNKKILILPVLYLFINFVSIFFAINKEVAIIEFSRTFKMIILFTCIVENFEEKEYLLFIKGLAVSTILQLIIGLIQLIKQDSVGLYFLGESRSVFRASVKGLEKGISGTLRHPGTLAIFSLFSLNMLLYANKEKVKLKITAIIASIMIICLTFSRTVILLMVGSIGMYIICQVFFFRTKENVKNKIKIKLDKEVIKKYLIPLILVITIVIIFLGIVVKRFINSDLVHQFNSRGEHTRIALDIYNRNGKKMSGANNYIIASQKIFPVQYSKGMFRYKQPVHNLYVLYLVELGLFGVMVYIIMNLLVIKRFITIKLSPKKVMYGCLCSTTIWTIVFLLYNLTGWSGAKDQITMIMWMTMALNYVAFNDLKNNGVDLI